jgi:hypothetical protein
MHADLSLSAGRLSLVLCDVSCCVGDLGRPNCGHAIGERLRAWCVWVACAPPDATSCHGLQTTCN